MNLMKDDCTRWQFYDEWIRGKELAVWSGGKWNSTARNRLNYCRRKGYHVQTGWELWNNNLPEIYSINTSATHRQGREMNPAYFDYPSPKTIHNDCPDHTYHLICVFGPELVAYAIVHHMGELMNISTIIGHQDKLKDGVMLLLTDAIQQLAVTLDVKAVTYGTWDSGTDGLRYFKHSTGFKPTYL